MKPNLPIETEPFWITGWITGGHKRSTQQESLIVKCCEPRSTCEPAPCSGYWHNDSTTDNLYHYVIECQSCAKHWVANTGCVRTRVFNELNKRHLVADEIMMFRIVVGIEPGSIFMKVRILDLEGPFRDQ